MKHGKKRDRSKWRIEMERFRISPDMGFDPPERMAPMGQVLRKVLSSLDDGRNSDEDLLAARWTELAGPRAAPHTRFGGLRNKALTVVVKNAVWMNELSRTETRGILSRACNLLGSGKVRRITMRVGDLGQPR